MTKGEAQRIARRARQYGYHEEGSTVYVFCPLCRERVSDDSGSWGGSVFQRLDRVMLAHVEDSHAEARKALRRHRKALRMHRLDAHE